MAKNTAGNADFISELEILVSDKRNTNDKFDIRYVCICIKSWIETKLLYQFLNFRECFNSRHNKIYVVKTPWNHIFCASIRIMLLFEMWFYSRLYGMFHVKGHP